MADTYVHRGWHDIGSTYVYWLATSWDPTGTSYVGPPPFGELSGITVSLFIPDAGGGGGGGTPVVENFDIAGPGDTSKVLTNTPLPGTLLLFLNGVQLTVGVGNDYTIAADTVTLLLSLEAGYRLGASYEF